MLFQALNPNKLNFLDSLQKRQDLSKETSILLAKTLLSQTISDALKTDLLDALSQKGESRDELLGFISVLTSRLIPLALNEACMDLCGTGGSEKNRFNTSTAVSFVLGSLGVPIVKHGNRGSKRANGSFDFLEQLGLPITHAEAHQKDLFLKHNLCFCFAKNHHPDMKHVAVARANCSKRSIFNVLGPLLNPAKASYHLLGVSNKAHFDLFCDVLSQLNYSHMLLVLGHNNLDEASITGLNACASIKGKHCESFELNPKDFNLYEPHLPEIADAKESASIFLDLIEHFQPTHPIFKLMCLNAGLALFTYGKTLSIQSGISSAAIAFESHLVKNYFQSYKKEALQLASQPI